MIGLVWNLTRGHRLTPWRSPYLRWRLETFSGIPADQVNGRVFCRFAASHWRDLLRYLKWADAMRFRRRR